MISEKVDKLRIISSIIILRWNRSDKKDFHGKLIDDFILNVLFFVMDVVTDVGNLINVYYYRCNSNFDWFAVVYMDLIDYY